MANVLQLKRGTTARRLTYTPAPGEPVVDLTQNKLYYGNGTTVGGVAVELGHALGDDDAARQRAAAMGPVGLRDLGFHVVHIVMLVPVDLST